MFLYFERRYVYISVVNSEWCVCFFFMCFSISNKKQNTKLKLLKATTEKTQTHTQKKGGMSQKAQTFATLASITYTCADIITPNNVDKYLTITDCKEWTLSQINVLLQHQTLMAKTNFIKTCYATFSRFISKAHANKVTTPKKESNNRKRHFKDTTIATTNTVDLTLSQKKRNKRKKIDKQIHEMVFPTNIFLFISQTKTQNHKTNEL